MNAGALKRNATQNIYLVISFQTDNFTVKQSPMFTYIHILFA